MLLGHLSEAEEGSVDKREGASAWRCLWSLGHEQHGAGELMEREGSLQPWGAPNQEIWKEEGLKKWSKQIRQMSPPKHTQCSDHSDINSWNTLYHTSSNPMIISLSFPWTLSSCRTWFWELCLQQRPSGCSGQVC